MFDIHQSIFDRRSGELDERYVEKYVDGLMEEFAASPEAQPIIEQFGDVEWVGNMLDFAFQYVGVEVPKMSVRDFDEILFDLFPRKISVEPESADAIVAELRAFWSFVHRQYGLANAQKIQARLTGDAVPRLKKLLSDPANFGMAKSFFMLGSKAGFDMTTQEGLDAFLLAYNSGLLNAQGGPDLPLPLLPDLDWDGGDDFDYDLPSLPPVLSHEEREKKRKAKKAQRQARKRK